ncbi:Forkhead domain protein [Aspergillus sclerotialis]|uniref:Forkhead domain protein n=1 Tax=Aspergillus sclerotialis TaxID=2070753 RepID=A0A3A2ZQ67_9EURO|nr:Forkhead domain protein [Aspergillus sclerotialis]
MANQKKTMSSEPPTPQRQRSGAKGGKATKISSKVRIGQDERLSRQRAAPTRRQQKDLYRQSPTSGLPIQEPSPAGAMVHPPVETFDLRHVIGCTDYSPTTPIFCDMDATQPDYFGPVNVGSLGWYGIHSLPNGMWTGHEMSTDLPIGV